MRHVPNQALIAGSCALLVAAAVAAQTPYPVDREMVAKIREEGLHRSRLPDTLSFMTDVLGGRLTNSAAMDRAQRWALEEMAEIGLENTVREPFMNYGASWDNEYFLLHMTAPVYQTLVGYPIAHTPGTDGRRELEVVIADVRSRGDLEALRGKLRGMAVLSTPPATVDRTRFATGTPSRTDEEMEQLAESVLPRSAPDPLFTSEYADLPPHPDVLTPVERLEFYVEEGAAAVLESRSGWPGAVRGIRSPRREGGQVGPRRDPRFAADHRDHPGALQPDVPRPAARSASDHRPRSPQSARRGSERGEKRPGRDPGSDRAAEIVMLGAHLDSWHASPNASDNTSGVAVMLEAMRILKAVGAQPRRTIRIALWSGEEQGIFGVAGLREEALRRSRRSGGGDEPDYDNFSVYFNQDYGPGRYRGVWLQENEHVRPISRPGWPRSTTSG